MAGTESGQGRGDAPFSFAAAATRRAWLALQATAGLTRRQRAGLLRAHGGDPAAALAAMPEGLAPGRVDAAAEARLEAFLSGGGQLLTLGHPDYPALLAGIDDPPSGLHVRGDITGLWRAQVAIVGSRQASRGGAELAAEFAADFVRAGLTVTSGLALGIDAAAHRGTLDAKGSTIAVMATGADRIYPQRHRDLAAAILDQGGVLVSEMPPGTAPLPELFPQRNRVISGLSLGTVVIEAGLASGSLVTARLAATQGREVYAVPGSVRHPLARGCHQLIREGAKLVESAAHVLEGLTPMAGVLADALQLRLALADPSPAGVGPAGRDPLLTALGRDPATLEELVRHTGQSAAGLQSRLLELELEGRIEVLPGGRFRALG